MNIWQRFEQRTWPINGGMTPVVRGILAINALVFLVQVLADGLLGGAFTRWFALRTEAVRAGALWQVGTYMFLHAGLGHVFINCLGLFFLGPEVERRMGRHAFLIMYLLSGILGGLGWVLLGSWGVCVGASGAVFGMLASYAVLFPQRRLMLWFLPGVPIRAWILVLAFGLLEYAQLRTLRGSHVAHAVHLAGGLAGAAYTWACFRGGVASRFQGSQPRRHVPRPTMSAGELDAILDKVARQGMSALTREERERLTRVSQERRRRG